MNTIIAQFEKQVRINPHAVALEYSDQEWTYTDLNHYANFIAEILVQNGIKASSVIAISGKKSLEMIAGIIAILKIKCTYMPIDVNLPTERIHYMISNAKASAVLSHGIEEPELKFGEIQHFDLNYSASSHYYNYPNPNSDIHSEDAAYVMHTSGSTGKPKGVVIPHRGVIRLLVNPSYIEIESSDSILFHSNTSFDAAIFEIWSGLLNGARIVISQSLCGDIPAIFKLCKEKKISILLLTTGLFHIFTNLPLEELSSLRYVVVGGDIMHSACALRAIKKNKSLSIINGYGPAENTVFTTCYLIKNENDVSNPIPIGKPIRGTEVHLLDASFRKVPQGEAGEIYVSGEGLALGYVNAPDLTQEKFLMLPEIAGKKLLYRTGDLARELVSGNFEFLGRRDNQVKIRGFRVELAEIEQVISGFSQVEDVCVSTIEQNDDRKIVAYVKVNAKDFHNREIYKAQIFSFLREKLPEYCIPSFLEISDHFPMTQNGKIDRSQIKMITLKKEETV